MSQIAETVLIAPSIVESDEVKMIFDAVASIDSGPITFERQKPGQS